MGNHFRLLAQQRGTGIKLGAQSCRYTGPSPHLRTAVRLGIVQQRDRRRAQGTVGTHR